MRKRGMAGPRCVTATSGSCQSHHVAAAVGRGGTSAVAGRPTDVTVPCGTLPAAATAAAAAAAAAAELDAATARFRTPPPSDASVVAAAGGGGNGAAAGRWRATSATLAAHAACSARRTDHAASPCVTFIMGHHRAYSRRDSAASRCQNTCSSTMPFTLATMEANGFSAMTPAMRGRRPTAGSMRDRAAATMQLAAPTLVPISTTARTGAWPPTNDAAASTSSCSRRPCDRPMPVPSLAPCPRMSYSRTPYPASCRNGTWRRKERRSRPPPCAHTITTYGWCRAPLTLGGAGGTNHPRSVLPSHAGNATSSNSSP